MLAPVGHYVDAGDALDLPELLDQFDAEPLAFFDALVEAQVMNTGQETLEQWYVEDVFGVD
jgi:hypothetical protein